LEEIKEEFNNILPKVIHSIAKYQIGDIVECDGKKGMVRSRHIGQIGKYYFEYDGGLLKLNVSDTVVCYRIAKINKDGTMHKRHDISYSPKEEKEIGIRERQTGMAGPGDCR
jgi:hypothetical protein